MYFVEKTKGTNYLKQFDYLLFISVLILSAIGILALRSATLAAPSIWEKQLVFLVFGVILSVIISVIDYKDLKTLGVILYIVCIALLVLVLVKGTTVNGSKSWLTLPIINRFQPSEITKIATILVASIFFERIKEGQNIGKNALKLMVYMAIPVLLILLQKDAGTAMVFMFSYIVMLFIFGIKYKYFVIAGLTFLASTPLLWFFVLRDVQKDRIISFLFPGTDSLGKTLQVDRSKMTIGSGQLWGKGLYHGIQTQNSTLGADSQEFMFKTVPFKHTDFIFAVVGEELGFIGSIFVILVIVFFLLRCLYISRNSRDPYGTFLVVGISAIFAFHFIENISMCIGVLPVTGIPLPFMSQGGTALISNYISIGVLLSVSMRRKRTIFNSTQ